MSDNKKYYYLKLRDNFFDSDEMIILESMPDGYIYSNILLKLYLRSLKYEGRLMFNDRIPFNSTMLSQVTRHSIGNVERAVQIFEDLGIIEVLDNGAIYMADIQNFIGTSSTEADRKRRYRQQIENEKKTGLIDKGQMVGHLSGQSSDKNPPEKEIEKELDIEIEKEQEVEQVDDEVYPGELIQTLYGQFPSALLSKAIAEWVQGWDRSMINYAIEIAYEYSIEINKLKPYLNKIFENWKIAKFTTVEQAKEANRKFKEQHAKPKSKVPAKQEVVPKWLADQQNEKQASKSVKQAEPVEAAVSEDEMEARLQAYLKRKEAKS